MRKLPVSYGQDKPGGALDPLVPQVSFRAVSSTMGATEASCRISWVPHRDPQKLERLAAVAHGFLRLLCRSASCTRRCI